MTALAVLAGVLLVGVGTADAGDGGWWRWKRKHRPSPTLPTARPSRSAGTPIVTVPPASPTTSPTGAPGSTSRPPQPSPTTGRYQPPPANVGVDYQIGTPYPLPSGVEVVSRDHGANPVAGRYNICYVNAFQAQPEEAGWWRTNHDDLLLKSNGGYVVDGDWNEILLDISTPAKRTAIAEIMQGWIDECAAKGFQAVEPDNLDSWTRSRNLLTRAHAEAFGQLLATRAHGRGLAIAQKNTVELAGVGRTRIGFDFAVAEECADYEISDGVPECQGYVDAYGDHVIVIEYDATHFQRACTRYGGRLSIIQRDRNVTAPGSSSYVYRSC